MALTKDEARRIAVAAVTRQGGLKAGAHRLMPWVTNALEICIKVRLHKVVTPRHDFGPRFGGGHFHQGLETEAT